MTRFFIALSALIISVNLPLQAQTTAAARCQSLNKGLNVSNWLEEYWNANWPQPYKYTKGHFEAMHDAGITSVRLPINFHAVTDTIDPYMVDTTHMLFHWVDSVIQWTDELDMKLLIDNHHGWFLDDQTFRENQLPRFSHLWGVVAKIYGHLDPDRVMFELLNEPMLGFNGDSLMVMFEDAIDSIRVYAPEHSIVVTPAWGGTAMAYGNFEPLQDTGLIYTWHVYDPLDLTHQGLTWHSPFYPAGTVFPSADTSFSESWLYTGWERVLDWKETHGRPVFLGEFGLSSNCDSTSVCNWLEYNAVRLKQNDIPWFYWDWQWDFSMFRSNNISEDSIYPCFKYYLGLYGDSAFTDVADAVYQRAEFSIYPNPNSEGQFSIQLNNHQNESHLLELYSYTGDLMFTDSFRGPNYGNKNRLSPGVYLVVISTESARSVRKLIVTQ